MHTGFLTKHPFPNQGNSVPMFKTQWGSLGFDPRHSMLYVWSKTSTSTASSHFHLYFIFKSNIMKKETCAYISLRPFQDFFFLTFLLWDLWFENQLVVGGWLLHRLTLLFVVFGLFLIRLCFDSNATQQVSTSLFIEGYTSILRFMHWQYPTLSL